MTWFKVDDSFYDHPKVDDLPDSAGMLWLRAGSYCARHLTDGVIPARRAQRLCDNPNEAIKALLDSGLWEVAEGGYRFHDWDVYQPSRDEVMSDREANAARQKAWRDRRKAEREARNGTPGRDVRRDRPVTDAVSNGVTDSVTNGARNASVTASVTGAPTRPVPTRPDPVVPYGTTDKDQNLLPAATRQAGHDDPTDADTIPGTSLAVVEGSNPAPKTRRGTRLPEQWQPSADSRTWFGETYAERVDVRTEHTKFVNYWLAKSGRDATKLDWDRTWRNWMITAAERAGTRPTVTALDDGRAVHRKTSSHLDHMSAYGDPDA